MKNLMKALGTLVVLIAMSGILIGCGSEDPETVATAMCEHEAECIDDDEGIDECVEFSQAFLEAIEEEDQDCYDAVADYFMCASELSCDATSGCEDEADDADDACEDMELEM